MKRKKELFIYSCCYINDNIEFKKFFKLLNINDDFKNYKIDCNKFISILLKNNFMIDIKNRESKKVLFQKFDNLLKNLNIKNFNLDLKSISNVEKDTITYNLNLFSKYIRKLGYELVKIEPINIKKKSNLYFIVLPIEKLLDLAEIGYMG
ncbi:MAG: hypothetical protein HFJ11_04920 [Bacilli bacterium]|nr:hypothetical protein [Bacilli bacterium]